MYHAGSSATDNVISILIGGITGIGVIVVLVMILVLISILIQVRRK